MRVDADLQFLQYCDNEELRTLCDILTFDNNGKIRFCDSLSKSANYQSYYPRNMVGMWKDLACEVQCYGGNSLCNLFRNGQGPSYEQIVYDVCKRMNIKDICKYDSAEDMEQKFLLAVARKAIDELSEDDIRAIMNECYIHVVGAGAMTRGAALLRPSLGCDIMGPAYHVTIPAVIQVAYMRLKYQAKLKTNSACA